MKTLLLTALTMVTFAGNSLLCRLALNSYNMDPASFTSIRLITGAITLWLLTAKKLQIKDHGSWPSALALFAYAACFSFAYVNLSASMGALLLFGAVQVTMISYGITHGEKLAKAQVTGLLAAIAGFAYLLWPGLSAPPLIPSSIMILSGIAWGAYSLLGKGALNPASVTAGNFLRSVPFTIVLSLVSIILTQETSTGSSLGLPAILIATTSGAVTSGLGYTLWYKVLPMLKSTSASTVQLSVPIITAFAGIIFLNESMSQRLLISSLAILGGITLVITQKQQKQRTADS